MQGQGSHRDWKMKMVMKKLWNMKDFFLSVMEFLSILLIKFSNLPNLCFFFANIKTFNTRLQKESPHFLDFSTKYHKK